MLRVLLLITIFVLSSCASVKKTNNLSLNKINITSFGIDYTLSEIDYREKIDLFNQKIVNSIKQASEMGEHHLTLLADEMYLKASDHSLNGDSYTASFLFNHLLFLRPKSGYLAKRYSIELIRIGELDKAKLVLEKAFKFAPNDESLGLILGGVYTTYEKEKEARIIYKMVLKNNPKSQEACIFLAKSFARGKRYQKSYRVLEGCKKSSKNNKAVFSFYKGKIALDRGHKKTAISNFKRSLNLTLSSSFSFLHFGRSAITFFCSACFGLVCRVSGFSFGCRVRCRRCGLRRDALVRS